MRITRPNARGLQRVSGLLTCAGFSLLELSAVVFIVTILVSLLCAALNHTKSKALRITCLDNMKELQAAWWLYTVDNAEAIPLNQRAPAPADPRIVQRRTSTNSWVAGNPVQDITTEYLTRGTLYEYLGSVSTFRCPMDYSTVRRKADVLRTRSYAMSTYLGGDPEISPMPKYKWTELSRPDNVFVFIEEHESSLWDSSFLVLPGVPRGRISAASSAAWASTPADRHAQGCNISFADGHIEYWRWYAPKEPTAPSHLASTGKDVRDITRLQSCVP